jgi:hypothetical protein
MTSSSSRVEWEKSRRGFSANAIAAVPLPARRGRPSVGRQDRPALDLSVGASFALVQKAETSKRLKWALPDCAPTLDCNESLGGIHPCDSKTFPVAQSFHHHFPLVIVPVLSTQSTVIG